MASAKNVLNIKMNKFVQGLLLKMSRTYERFDLNFCDFLGETFFVIFDFPPFEDHSKNLKKFKDIFYDNFKLYQYFYDIGNIT